MQVIYILESLLGIIRLNRFSYGIGFKRHRKKEMRSKCLYSLFLSLPGNFGMPNTPARFIEFLLDTQIFFLYFTSIKFPGTSIKITAPHVRFELN